MLRKLWFKFIYKPGSHKIYWEKVISSSIVLVSFIVWAYFNQKAVNKLERKRNNNAKYTVGITTASYFNVKGGRYIDYKYNVGGTDYTGSKRWPITDNRIYTKGGRYLVKLDSTNLLNSEILFYCPVPPNIEIPQKGWVEKPFLCEEK